MIKIIRTDIEALKLYYLKDVKFIFSDCGYMPCSFMINKRELDNLKAITRINKLQEKKSFSKDFKDLKPIICDVFQVKIKKHKDYISPDSCHLIGSPYSMQKNGFVIIGYHKYGDKNRKVLYKKWLENKFDVFICLDRKKDIEYFLNDPFFEMIKECKKDGMSFEDTVFYLKVNRKEELLKEYSKHHKRYNVTYSEECLSDLSFKISFGKFVTNKIRTEYYNFLTEPDVQQQIEN